mmetsp:Transcript_33183/g.73360  ORF Transcript_33183/g.73360 Transcript_33183/m.73360 type:complete len:80 (-) Transcript_33183:1241-1480(-)
MHAIYYATFLIMSSTATPGSSGCLSCFSHTHIPSRAGIRSYWKVQSAHEYLSWHGQVAVALWPGAASNPPSHNFFQHQT